MSVTTYASVFSLQARGAGKWYAEVVPTAVVAGSLTPETLVGATYQAAPSDAAPPTDFGVGAFPDGSTTFDGVALTPMAGYASGDTIMIAVDGDQGLVWFGVNGTFTGDPGAGTDPANAGFPMPANDYTIFVSFELNIFNPTEGCTSVLNAKASQQAYSPPTGFSAWEDA